VPRASAARKPADRRSRAPRVHPDAILEAALTCFGRHGFRRTSLEEIAQEAGLSRTALYLHYENKEAIFRALATRLHERALRAAGEAARAPGPAGDRVAAVLEAKYGLFFDVVQASPHAAELLDESSRQCGDLSADSRRRFLRALSGVLARADVAGEIRLRAAGLQAAEAAELLMDAARGLER
jgi:AcrR family transcriptional regulator